MRVPKERLPENWSDADVSVFERPPNRWFLRLAGDRIAARACDNRIGTWSAAEALRHLATERERLSASVVAVSTIQEENGLYGATMAGYRVRPDVALVVDVTHATDIPICSKPKHGDVKLGGGPVISIGSANHPVLVERLRKIAAEKTIPIQFEVNPRFTGTDADAIFVQRGGIPTVCIGLPNRYMHSPVEVIDLSRPRGACRDFLPNFAWM